MARGARGNAGKTRGSESSCADLANGYGNLDFLRDHPSEDRIRIMSTRRRISMMTKVTSAVSYQT